MVMAKNFDFIVVGSGLAGLSFALKASQLGRVAVISKSELIQTNTWRAQGGVAAVIAKSDSFAKHIEDTLIAGDGLCDPKAVTRIIESAPKRITELQNYGVEFDQEDGHIALAREGGHTERRILHIDDQTGQALHSRFINLAEKESNITLFENLFVTELTGDTSTCTGLKAFDSKNFYDLKAPYVLLATGGTGKTFLYTSNWSGATGDGIAMAYRLGATINNIEFTQFHPTCLYHPLARNFLISEALRGEGARLLNKKGEAFMQRYHPQKELAPRDKVSRAIDQEMKSSGSDCVWLDLSYLNKPELKDRFPKIYAKCKELGIDFLKQPIPVVPAAHYMCGGIAVNEHFATDISGLYAIGECCDSGLHGANRLASNSLLECLVSAHYAFKNIQNEFKPLNLVSEISPRTPHKSNSAVQLADSQIQLTSLWEETRQLMWLNMGIVRSQKLMKRAEKKIQHIKEEVHELSHSGDLDLDPNFIELKNIVTVADLMIQAALHRKESRGCHFDQDYPEKATKVKKSRQRRGLKVEYIEI